MRLVYSPLCIEEGFLLAIHETFLFSRSFFLSPPSQGEEMGSWKAQAGFSHSVLDLVQPDWALYKTHKPPKSGFVIFEWQPVMKSSWLLRQFYKVH